MSEVALRKFKDVNTGEEFDIKTAFVTRDRQITMPVKCPLYESGQIISNDRLADLGIEIREYTQDELDQITFGNYYTANPGLAGRVRTYRDHMNALELPYDANSDQTKDAIQNSGKTETEQLELSALIQTAFHDIVVNLEALGIYDANYMAWTLMPKLVQYLPPEETE